jgi:hypothetical protein
MSFAISFDGANEKPRSRTADRTAIVGALRPSSTWLIIARLTPEARAEHTDAGATADYDRRRPRNVA